MQPQQRALEQLGRIAHFRLEDQVVVDRLQQPAERRFGQQIRAPGSWRKATQQVIEQPFRCRPPQTRSAVDEVPLALQPHLHGLRIAPAAQPQIAPASVLVASRLWRGWRAAD